MLGLSQSDVARDTGLSLPTIKRAESQREVPISDDAMEAIQAALEAAGVEFTNGDQPGVRLRRDGLKDAGPMGNLHRYSAVLLDNEDHLIDLGPVILSDAQNDQDAARLGEIRARELLQSMGRTVASLKITDGPRGLELIKVRV